MPKFIVPSQNGDQQLEDFFARQRGVNDNNVGKVFVPKATMEERHAA